MKSSMSNFAKVFPVGVALIYVDRRKGRADGQNEANGSPLIFLRTRLKKKFCTSLRKTKNHLMLYREI